MLKPSNQVSTIDMNPRDPTLLRPNLYQSQSQGPVTMLLYPAVDDEQQTLAQCWFDIEPPSAAFAQHHQCIVCRVTISGSAWV